MALPTVDISLFTNGDSCGRRQAALTLLESLRQHGFVKVVGHGICEKTIGQLMEWVNHLRSRKRRFADLKNTFGVEQILLSNERRGKSRHCPPWWF